MSAKACADCGALLAHKRATRCNRCAARWRQACKRAPAGPLLPRASRPTQSACPQHHSAALLLDGGHDAGRLYRCEASACDWAAWRSTTGDWELVAA